MLIKLSSKLSIKKILLDIKLFNVLSSLTLFSILLLSFVTLTSCNVEPEPIEFGKEDCNYCKMKIMDSKFGAEIVTKKGKVFKFDDVNCMVRHIKDEKIDETTLEFMLIIDYSKAGSFLDVKKAYFIRSEQIKSPMGSYIAAFQTKDNQTKYNTKWNGELWNWSKIKQTFN